MLKETEVEVTYKNKEVDKVNHQYVSEQSSYGRCSADWRKARREIQEDPEMRKELVKKLQALV